MNEERKKERKEGRKEGRKERERKEKKMKRKIKRKSRKWFLMISGCTRRSVHSSFFISVFPHQQKTADAKTNRQTLAGALAAPLKREKDFRL